MTSARRSLDRYYTPADVADACVATLPDLRGLHVVEPSIGRGMFALACEANGAHVLGVDIDPDCPALGLDGVDIMIVDFAHWTPAAPVDWVVGNPPYSDAEAHVRRSLDYARRGAGFLLRLAFLESLRRRPLWSEHPPSEVYVLDRRPSFTEDGRSDSAAYGWFVWHLDRPHRGTRLDWLRWST